MELIKKAILELWCMAYGAVLFLIAWWIVVAIASLVAVIMFVVYVVTPKKTSSRTLDES